MKHTLLFAVAALFLAGCAGPIFREPPPPLAPAEIVALAKAGEMPANIITRIQTSRTVYNLTASQLVQLSHDGVPDVVLDYMQRTQLQEIARDARREAANDIWWSGGPWYGYPWLGSPARIIYYPVRPPH